MKDKTEILKEILSEIIDYNNDSTRTDYITILGCSMSYQFNLRQKSEPGEIGELIASIDLFLSAAEKEYTKVLDTVKAWSVAVDEARLTAILEEIGMKEGEITCTHDGYDVDFVCEAGTDQCDYNLANSLLQFPCIEYTPFDFVQAMNSMVEDCRLMSWSSAEIDTNACYVSISDNDFTLTFSY